MFKNLSYILCQNLIVIIYTETLLKNKKQDFLRL